MEDKKKGTKTPYLKIINCKKSNAITHKPYKFIRLLLQYIFDLKFTKIKYL